MSKASHVCELIVTDLIDQGFIRISRQKLEETIMQHRGIDERTVARWTRALLTLNYIKGVGPNLFEINILMIPNVIARLKDKQTKIQ